MEDNLKAKIIVILAISTVLFLVTTVTSCSQVRRHLGRHRQEMEKRLDFEEQTSKLAKDKAVLEEKIKKLTAVLEEKANQTEKAAKALSQEELINQSLKEEIAKLSKRIEKLEIDLKEALAVKSADNVITK
jgi:chromosome segregation ATPase